MSRSISRCSAICCSTKSYPRRSQPYGHAHRPPHPVPASPCSPSNRSSRPSRCDGVGLVLQGGGALGAYQAGVYQALHEAGLEPDWVVGVSIGSINSAIIAGNKPEHRLEKLEKFWLDITARDPFTFWPEGDVPRKLRNGFSAMKACFSASPAFSSRPPECLARAARLARRNRLLRHLAFAQNA